MEPIDYRNATWTHIKGHLAADRLEVWRALSSAGTVSTRELAAAMSWDILNVRPRMTELVEIGFACLVKDDMVRRAAQLRGVGPREGLYKAASEADAYAAYIERHKFASKEQQPSLPCY